MSSSERPPPHPDPWDSLSPSFSIAISSSVAHRPRHQCSPPLSPTHATHARRARRHPPRHSPVPLERRRPCPIHPLPSCATSATIAFVNTPPASHDSPPRRSNQSHLSPTKSLRECSNLCPITGVLRHLRRRVTARPTRQLSTKAAQRVASPPAHHLSPLTSRHSHSLHRRRRNPSIHPQRSCVNDRVTLARPPRRRLARTRTRGSAPISHTVSHHTAFGATLWRHSTVLRSPGA